MTIGGPIGSVIAPLHYLTNIKSKSMQKKFAIDGVEMKETREELRDRVLATLQSMAEPELGEDRYRNPEADHQTADQLLLELIGDPEITAAFGAIEKWYS